MLTSNALFSTHVQPLCLEAQCAFDTLGGALRMPIALEPWRVCASTQVFAWEGVSTQEPHTLRVIWTPEQTQGQGTQGRVWHSTPWHTLTFSLAYVLPEAHEKNHSSPMHHWWQTTPLSAWLMQQVHQALQLQWDAHHQTPCPVLYKPVNDLVDTQGFKLAGGLTQHRRFPSTTSHGALRHCYVMGVGLNVWALQTPLVDARHTPQALATLWKASGQPFPFGDTPTPQGLLGMLQYLVVHLSQRLPQGTHPYIGTKSL